MQTSTNTSTSTNTNTSTNTSTSTSTSTTTTTTTLTPTPNPNPNPSPNQAAEVYRADDSSEGVTSIHAMSNALSLTLRPPGTMKFVKYVSAAAPGSRWDVAAEYTVQAAQSAKL